LKKAKLRVSRRLFFKPSLRTRLVGIMLVTNMSLIALLVFFYYQTEKALYNEFARQTAGLSKAVQIGLAGAASKNLGDVKSLENYLNRLTPKGVKEISVISSSDRIVASTKRENVGKWITERRRELIFKADLGESVTGEGLTYNVVIPVAAEGEGKPMGYIHLTLNAEDFSAFLRLSLIRRVLAALVIFAVGTLVAVVLAGRYIRPIKQVVAAAGKVAAGDLRPQLPVVRRDEIGDLSRSFNHMVARLREDRDLRERLRTAEHLASVGQFAQSIAHEIKNPLNFISLSIDHMRDAYRPAEPETSARFESLVGNIKGEIQRISRFAESFLEYGRPFELRLRQASMVELIEEALELAQARAQQGRIEIIREFEGLPPIIIDPEFIRTCLNNVICNAFDAMPDGGTLRVQAERKGRRVAIAFADSGVGVEAAKLDKVFDPFFTTKQGGLGLGLALTRKIVEEHGGKVQFVSRPGEGSVVTLLLPLAKEATA
jgi:signal transduction histidine kinase